jgi:hypothetical protein
MLVPIAIGIRGWMLDVRQLLASSIQQPTTNNQQPTTNIQHPASKHPKSNIQQLKSNILLRDNHKLRPAILHSTLRRTIIRNGFRSSKTFRA